MARMFGRRLSGGVLAAVAGFAPIAGADVVILEGADFPGVSSFNPDRAFSLGTLSLGTTIVRGRLAGNALAGDANPANGGDTQDSFLIELPAGLELSGVGFATRGWSLAGIQRLSVSLLVLDTSSGLVQSGTGFIPADPSFPLAMPAPAGTYAVSLYGQSSFFATGSYTLDYDIFITTIPSPGVLAAAAIAGGAVGVRRRRRA